MEKQIESEQIQAELTFYTPDSTPLNFQAIALTLTKKEETIHRCCLGLLVNYPFYQIILKNSLFNLKPEANYSDEIPEFQPDIPINLEVELRPDWLPQIAEKGKNSEDIVNYLVNLSLPSNLAQAHNATENWYCLSVKQHQETKEVGYRTLWGYVNLGQMNEVISTGNQIVESLSNLIKEASESFLENPETVKDEDFPINIMQLLEKFDSHKPQSISEISRQFFDEDDWNFAEVDGESVLQMAFQGENGRWTCYACTFEDSEQFVFYSVCPLVASPEVFIQITEYLMRANYGLIIGNFELDFSDGEIRYKTSIDVENETVSTSIIKNLVYTNVAIFDKYLPGIVSVINNQLSPIEAIALVENQTELELNHGTAKI